MSNGEFGFRASRRDKRVLVAVRELDHPGVIADCIRCMGERKESRFGEGNFFTSIVGHYRSMTSALIGRSIVSRLTSS